MDAAVIQVNMLGGFSIRRGDAEVTVNARSKKLCLLLACLIRERKRTVLYSELLDLLWEGQDSDSTAFNALKAILHRARNFLDELGIFALSLSGITLYYYFENTALTYTLAANVSIILAAAPVFTAILAHVFTRDEKLSPRTWAGFFIAITGVVLVVFNGTFVLKLNPAGDVLSLLAALSWAVYSVLLKRYVEHYDNGILTRKMLFYASILTLPAVLAGNGLPSPEPLAKGEVVFCLLFLGVLGSANCYITWNKAIERIGVVNTNNYIYLNPFKNMTMAGPWWCTPLSQHSGGRGRSRADRGRDSGIRNAERNVSFWKTVPQGISEFHL